MSTTQRIIDAAVAMTNAEHAVTHAKHAYYSALDDYFVIHGRPEGKFSRDDEKFLPVIEATDEHYQMFQKAKRTLYNRRRRLRTAVAAHKLAFINQEGQPCE